MRIELRTQTFLIQLYSSIKTLYKFINETLSKDVKYCSCTNYVSINEYEAVMTNIDPLGQSLYEQWSHVLN